MRFQEYSEQRYTAMYLLLPNFNYTEVMRALIAEKALINKLGLVEVADKQGCSD